MTTQLNAARASEFAARFTERADYARREVPRGPAPWPRRACAGAIDFAAVALPLVIGAMIVHSLRDANGGGEADRFVFGTVTVLIAAGFFVWNFGFRQGRTGQSVGKQWLGLAVRRSSGSSAAGGPLGVGLSLRRQLLRGLDYASLAGIARPIWDSRGRSFADQVAGADVVRIATAVDEGFEPTAKDMSVAALRTRRLVGLGVLIALLSAVLLASVAVGARPMTMAEIGHAVFPRTGLGWPDLARVLHDPVRGLAVIAGKVNAAYSSPTSLDTDAIVRSLRVPRALLGLVVGIALGVVGALLQAYTRNPLADPELLGINIGSALAVVAGVYLVGIGTPQQYVWFAFAGALVASVTVFGLAAVGNGRASPLSLVLAGAAVAAFFGSMTSTILLLSQSTLDSFRFWAVGSVAGRSLDILWTVLPFIVVGLLIAVAATPGLNVLSLGEDVARSLGTNIALNRTAGIVAITLLTGAATAACGPIAFLALVVPHVARAVTGPDHRWLVPYAGLMGGILLVVCDVLGRVVLRPGELEVGIVLALFGAPFFIALVRKRKLVAL